MILELKFYHSSSASLSLFFLACFSVESLSSPPAYNTALVTEGQWILNKTSGKRLRLKCVNWYGAHQELHVVGGLELRSVVWLTNLLKASGANCVRLPYSVEMVKYNPIVDRNAVAGILPSDGCQSTLLALDIMDCVVHHLQIRGILIIFNNHNSHGTWVGAGAVKNDQGLWNLPGYSTEDWIQSMEIITRRYKIAGMDFRNEIHDQDGVRVTWGETDDINTDWLAASTVAYDRLYRIDPEIIAIIGGLCWNTDLRSMVNNVGPVQAFQNKKLVYTVHVYTFSFWWNNLAAPIIDPLTSASLWSFILCLMVSITCFFKQWSLVRKGEYIPLEIHYKKNYFCDTWSKGIKVFVSTSLLFQIGWLSWAVFYYNAAKSAGCSSFANDSIWLIILASIFMAIAFCSGLLLWCKERELSPHLITASWLLWISLFFLGMFIVGKYLTSHTAYYDSLKAWSLENRPVPVMIGEFGTGNPDEPIFRLIWRYIHEKYNLDFAYWAFNGRKWQLGVWESEGFGLMDNKYLNWRFPDFMQTMFHSGR